MLLSPGTAEMELGFTYKQNRSGYKLMQAGYFERSSYSARQLELALTARGGLWDGAEGHITMPFTYGQVKEVSSNEWVRSKNNFAVGDLSFGVQQLLHRESENLPAISASMAVNAPTGSKSYRDVTNTWKDALDNGSGHWSLAQGLSFVRTTDPAILFGGVTYQYSFENTIDGYRIKPGWGLIGYMGLGFALNDKLSVGMRTSHGYYAEMTADGQKVQGSDCEPTDLSFSASYRAWENWVVTPQVTFGLNDDAGSPSLGVRLTRRF